MTGADLAVVGLVILIAGGVVLAVAVGYLIVTFIRDALDGGR